MPCCCSLSSASLHCTQSSPAALHFGQVKLAAIAAASRCCASASAAAASPASCSSRAVSGVCASSSASSSAILASPCLAASISLACIAAATAARSCSRLSWSRACRAAPRAAAPSAAALRSSASSSSDLTRCGRVQVSSDVAVLKYCGLPDGCVRCSQPSGSGSPSAAAGVLGAGAGAGAGAAPGPAAPQAEQNLKPWSWFLEQSPGGCQTGGRLRGSFGVTGCRQRGGRGRGPRVASGAVAAMGVSRATGGAERHRHLVRLHAAPSPRRSLNSGLCR